MRAFKLAPRKGSLAAQTGEPLGGAVEVPAVIIPFMVYSWYRYVLDHDSGGAR